MNLRNLFSFCFFQSLLWVSGAIGYFLIAGLPTDVPGVLFAVTFWLSHPFTLAGLLFLFCAPFVFIGPRTLTGICIGLGGFSSAFFAVDLLVYSQYRFHIGPAMLELFFGPAGREIFAFTLGVWIVSLLSFGFVLLLELGLVKLAKRCVFSKRMMITFLAIWLGLFLTYNISYMWGKFRMVPSIMSQRTVLPFAFPMSANRRLAKLGFTPAKDPYFISKHGSFLYPLVPVSCNTSGTPQNILIILVDALRADVLNPEVMPRTYAWAQQSGMSTFLHHLSGGNATAGGVFSLFYGIPHSYWDNVTGFHILPLLLSRAWEQNYEPAIFASSQLNSPAFNNNIFSTIENLRIGSSGNSSWERDENAIKDFESFLNKRDKKRPFFGFLFLDAPHAYAYPQQDRKFTPSKPLNYLTLTKNTDPLPYFNEYKNAVYFSDRMIDRVLTELNAKGLLKDTWVLITGDHGQELNDSGHNFWGHNSNYTDYQTHVPLIVFNPSQNTSQKVDYFTSHYDIAPTLLQLIFGCTNPAEDYSIGRNLFDSTPRPFFVFSSYTAKSVRIGNDIIVFNNLGGIEQYDHHYRSINHSMDPESIKEALKMFSKFYK